MSGFARVRVSFAIEGGPCDGTTGGETITVTDIPDGMAKADFVRSVEGMVRGAIVERLREAAGEQMEVA